MIIERLHLDNFGIYGGRHTFELAPDPLGGKPIVLIEGHNGAGKTTFLDAIRLALYGKVALGNRVSQKAYEAYLRDRLHRGGENDIIEISLELSRHENGVQRHYEITRQWQIGRTAHGETLSVSIDGNADEDASAEEWQDLLNDLVPSGVSQLFFFDGEKIQDIADGDASAGLQQAIGPLLGLDLIEQLRTDLALFVARQKTHGAPGELEAAEIELSAVAAELVLAEEKRAQLTSDCDQAFARIRRAEATYRKEGGLAAHNENDAKHEQRRLEEERQDLLSDLRELASGIGPLLLAPKTLSRLAEAATEVKIRLAKLAAAQLIDEFEALNADQTADREAIWQQFRAFVATDREDLPAWSEGNIDHLLARLAAAAEFDRSWARALGKKLDDNVVRTQAAADQAEAFAKGLGNSAFEEIREAEFERGRLSAALEEQNGAVARLRARKDRTAARCERMRNDLFDAERLNRSAALASKARAALIAYEERILADRIGALEHHVLASLHKLLRRPNLVERVSLDPETFEVLLFGSDDRVVALDSLSAGERQLFAVALLWALARTSERALPLVIDTPLGRLDRMHRERIIAQYLAGASEQVVLLCTDTELTEDVATQLAPFVSRRLSLAVGNDEGCTRVSTVPENDESELAYAAV